MLALTLAYLLAQEPAPADPWIVLRPQSLRSTAGSTLELRPDGSIFASGAAVPQDVYELECEVPADALVALRIEVLPDPALPLGGAGRSANSNVCVTEVEVEAGAASKGRRLAPVTFIGVHQTRGDAGSGRRLIDRNPSSYWVLHGSTGEPGFLVLLADAPLAAAKGTTLRVRIRQESQHSNHGLGRFRLAVTADPSAAEAYAPKKDPLALRVDAATWNGIQFLLKRQHPDGTWMNWLETHMFAGTAALCGYSLYKAGVPKDHAALQTTLTWLETHPAEHTYDASLRILWYLSLDPQRYRAQIEQAAEVLTYMPEQYFTYGYAGGQGPGGDLSNHQFAVVALHALDEHGFELDPKLWRRLAERIVGTQKPDGSWGYYPQLESTPTMSLAGLAVAAACRNALARGGAPKRDVEVMQRAVDRGIAFCGENFLLDQPRDRGPLDRWFWYACYGMERVAAIADVTSFGRHDWYAEVADQLCNEQGGDGGWRTPWGDEDVSTAFCLLTLARATAATGMPSISARFAPRWSNAGAEGDLTITATGAPDVQVFLAGIGRKAIEDYAWKGEKRPRLLDVQWYLDGKPVGEPVPNEDPIGTARGGFTPRCPDRLTLPGNGAYVLEAVARVQPPDDAEAEAEELRSPPLKLEVRGLLDPPRVLELARMRREPWQMLPDLRESSCSSTQDEGKCAPIRAFDRAQSTRWACEKEDPEPWIKVEFRRGVQVGALRLLPVLDPGRMHDGLGLDVPRRVRVTLNDRDERIVEMGPEHMLPGFLIELDKKVNVRRLEVRVLERDPGANYPGYVGWREIQLLTPED